MGFSLYLTMPNNFTCDHNKFMIGTGMQIQNNTLKNVKPELKFAIENSVSVFTYDGYLNPSLVSHINELYLDNLKNVGIQLNRTLQEEEINTLIDLIKSCENIYFLRINNSEITKNQLKAICQSSNGEISLIMRNCTHFLPNTKSEFIELFNDEEAMDNIEEENTPIINFPHVSSVSLYEDTADRIKKIWAWGTSNPREIRHLDNDKFENEEAAPGKPLKNNNVRRKLIFD